MNKPHTLRYRSSGPDQVLDANDGLTGQAVVGAGDGVLTFAANGATGSTGPTGATGSAGPTGPTGATGPQTSAILRGTLTIPTLAAGTITVFTYAAGVPTTNVLEVYPTPNVNVRVLYSFCVNNAVAQIAIQNNGTAINPAAASVLAIPQSA